MALTHRRVIDTPLRTIETRITIAVALVTFLKVGINYEIRRQGNVVVEISELSLTFWISFALFSEKRRN